MKAIILIMFLFPTMLFARGRTHLVFDGTIAIGGQVTTRPIQMVGYQHASIHHTYTGTGISGGCQMQVSNDNENWVNVTGAFLPLVDGGTSDFINVQNIASGWMRAFCSNASGTGAAEIKIWLGGK